MASLSSLDGTAQLRDPSFRCATSPPAIRTNGRTALFHNLVDVHRIKRCLVLVGTSKVECCLVQLCRGRRGSESGGGEFGGGEGSAGVNDRREVRCSTGTPETVSDIAGWR
jgi:hypothetical protein